MCENTILNFLRKIADENDLTNSTCDLQRLDMKGESYMSVLHKATITSDTKKINLFVKTAPENLREVMPVRIAFEKEVTFYEKISPILKRVAGEIGEEEILCGFLPKVYKTNLEEGKEIVIVEDLVDYEQVDRKVAMGEERIEAVLKELGKFHALGFAVKMKKAKEFEELKKAVYLKIYATAPDFIIESFLGLHKKIGDILEKRGLKECIEKHRNFFPQLLDYLTGKIPEEDEFKVFLHMDLWKTNVMFTKKPPLQVKLIDFQYCTYDHIVKDISYFIFLNSSKETINKTNKFLTTYFERLSENLKILGVEPFSFAIFKEEWKKHARHALAVVPTLYTVQICEPDEVPVCNDPEITEKFLMDKKKEEDFEEFVVGLVRYMCEEKLIS